MRVKKRIAELDRDILTVREQQREAQGNLQAAELLQVDALRMEQEAHDQFKRAVAAATDAREMVETCARRIGDLQDERAAIPRQRQGG